MDRLDAFRLFVRVAETGGFSRAAREAGVAQPVVSRAVAALEQQLGVRLLHRTTRRLALTEAGQRAYERAKMVLAEVEALELSVRGAEHEPVGLLRISGSVAFIADELAPLTAAFLEAYPHVRLDFATSDERVDLIAEGVDLAFRLGTLNDSRMTARRLGAYSRVIVAAPAHLAAFGAPQTPEGLRGAKALIFTAAAFGALWPLTDGKRTVQIETEGPVRAATGPVVRELALQGLGLAFVPQFLVQRSLERGDLVRVLPQWWGPPLDLHAVWQGRALPRKARAYLDFIAPRLTTQT